MATVYSPDYSPGLVRLLKQRLDNKLDKLELATSLDRKELKLALDGRPIREYARHKILSAAIRLLSDEELRRFTGRMEKMNKDDEQIVSNDEAGGKQVIQVGKYQITDILDTPSSPGNNSNNLPSSDSKLCRKCKKEFPSTTPFVKNHYCSPCWSTITTESWAKRREVINSTNPLATVQAQNSQNIEVDSSSIVDAKAIPEWQKVEPLNIGGTPDRNPQRITSNQIFDIAATMEQLENENTALKKDIEAKEKVVIEMGNLIYSIRMQLKTLRDTVDRLVEYSIEEGVNINDG